MTDCVFPSKGEIFDHFRRSLEIACLTDGNEGLDSGFESIAFHQEDPLQVWLCSALVSQDSINELVN